MLLPLLLIAPTFAAEGMWLPSQIQAAQLESLGFEIPVRAFSDAQSSVLGPVVSMGHCTASFVSEDGLLITNGHCVRSFLQYASSGEQNLVQDGFIAADRTSEAWAGPAARIYIPEETRDVTAQVEDNLKAARTDADRHLELQRIRSYITSVCEAEDGVRCEVVDSYGGSQWDLVKYREIHDLRIVYAPPDDVVFFGGETDNWMWPRHAGDMALLRAYVGPDQTPVAHASENQPYRPSAWLQVGTDDLDPGDPVLIAGFPAQTSRYRTAAEIKHAALVHYPEGVELFTDLILALREHAITSDDAATRLGPMIFSLSNQRKNYQGMIDNMNRDDLVQRQVEFEASLDAWVQAERKRKRTYAKPIAELREHIADQQRTHALDRLVQLMSRYPSELYISRTAYRLALERQKEPLDRRPGYQPRDEQRIADRFEQLSRSVYLPAEEDVMRIVLTRYTALESEQHIDALDAWLERRGGIDKTLDALFPEASPPTVQDSGFRAEILSRELAAFQANDDANPWIELAVILEDWNDSRQQEQDALAGALERLRPQMMRARVAMEDGPVYPDANGTLRISLGQIAGYDPQEAVVYAPQTTVRGMVAKAGSAPFALPPEVQDAGRTAEKSRWTDPELGTVPLNFLASLDNTGGSSGSPTLNARGELIGLAFDRNYEGMAADWAFDHHVTRSIHLDLRFSWWLMSEVQAAEHLLIELGLTEAAPPQE